ncbi:hypothetical protein Ahy_A05g025744 [Arachis hypogaea]|uniref:Uncharacterized protein n=1 Tax=Arachis hypogaea TaxID=3818 RepID=A0A445D9E7_ARAHY|nr:hypothetical protein Ahy_A05g025744 [Arachis hypogaea]
MESERGSPPQRRCSRRHCRRGAGSPEGRERRFADEMEREDEDATQERRLFRRALSSLLGSIEAAAAARACRAPGVNLCASHRVPIFESGFRRELKELGVTLPKDAFELIFVFLQEW